MWQLVYEMWLLGVRNAAIRCVKCGSLVYEMWLSVYEMWLPVYEMW